MEHKQAAHRLAAGSWQHGHLSNMTYKLSKLGQSYFLSAIRVHQQVCARTITISLYV